MSKKPMAEADQEGAQDPAEARALAERFSKLVKSVGGPTRAGDILGVRPNTIHTWTKGTSKIPFYAVLRLSQEADLSLDSFAIGGDESAPGLPALPVFADAGSVPEGFVVVPTFDVQASAGNGAVAAGDMESSDLVAFRHVWLRSLGLTPGRVHILWATGDSMFPTIRDGDMLLIDRTIDRVVNDGIYVVVAGGAVRVKRIYMRQNGSVVLRSDNDRYPEEVVPVDEVPQLVVEGRVRWVGGAI